MKYNLHMKPAILTSLVLAALIASSSAAEPPDFLAFRHDVQGPPIWVSAAAARGPNGELDPSLFRPDRWESLGSYTSANRRLEAQQRLRQGVPQRGEAPRQGPPAETTCAAYVGASPNTGFKPRETLGDLVESSLVIVLGEIEEITQGFYGGTPSSLLTLSGVQILKSSPEYSFDQVHVRYHWAAFRVGSRVFCAEDDGFLHRPAVGEKILVFGYFEPRNLERNVIDSVNFATVVETLGGDLLLPERLRGRFPGLTMEGLRARVEHELRGGEE